MHIKVNGASLFFDVEGAKLVADGPRMREKPTLILLHGAPGVTDHSSFKPLFSRLTEAAQIIYLDLRGGGRSPDPDPSNWTLAQWADDLNDFCQTLGVDRPVVLGQSGGGFVAMAYAARYPEAPAGLILASTQARFSADRCLSVFRRLGGERAERAAASFFRSPTAPDALVAFREHCLSLYNRNPQDTESPQRVVRSPDLWSRFGPSWYVGPVELDLLAALKTVRCPTLILAGEDDPICPVEDAEDILTALSHTRARLVRFPECGHGVWRDDPDGALRAIRDFLREVAV